MIELSVILPVLNEETIIGPVVKDIQKYLDKVLANYEIILVDNGSVDQSFSVITSMAQQDKHLRAFHLAQKGWGRAIKYGWKNSNGKYVLHMPSDGQIDPKILPILLVSLRHQEADLVKIRRVVRESIIRKANSIIYNLIANLLFQVGTTDTNGCPKIFPKEYVKTLALQANDSFLDLELLAKARVLGLKIKEFPIEGKARVGGKSNTNLLTVIEFLKNMIKFRFSQDFQKWKSSLKVN